MGKDVLQVPFVAHGHMGTWVEGVEVILVTW
jgi:hypothetical protein